MSRPIGGAGPVSRELEASYTHCERLARRKAKNFYLSFWLLPRDKRRAMSALYAFLRHTDDLVDDPRPLSVRRESLASWRESMERALLGSFDSPIWPALVDTVARYRIPPEYLREVIRGVEMDLSDGRYETFDQLALYCYRVASVVGLSCIHIWGFRGREALEPAQHCGTAFQLTNILRDLKEDAQQGRFYLPREDLDRFGYTIDDLCRGVRDERLARLIRFEVERVESFYRLGAELERWLGEDGRRIFRTMTGIYHGLLDEIKRREGDVLDHRIRLSPWRKMAIAARCLAAAPRLTPAPAAVRS